MPSLEEVLATAQAIDTVPLNACHNDGCTNERCLNPQSVVLATAAGLDARSKFVCTRIGEVVRYHLGVFAAGEAAKHGTEVRPYYMCEPCLVALIKVLNLKRVAKDQDTVIAMLKAAEERATAERRERYPEAKKPAAPTGAVLPGRRRVAS